MSTTLVVILLLAVVLLAAMISLLWRRRAVDARDAPQSDSQLPAAPTAIRPERQVPLDLADPEGVMLIPLPNGQDEALVLGSESALQVFDQSGLTASDAMGGRSLLPQLVRQVIGAGGGEATRRAQQGIDSGRIVALAPETVEQLKRGR